MQNKPTHEEMIKTLPTMTPEEIIEWSKVVGYPVFTRLCMDSELQHKFVLLQDGASAIIENENGQILLQSRADRDKWGLPGGCQELGERFEETIIREIKEETNLDVLESDLTMLRIVSGLSRKSTYPNGDIVINNTVLYLVKKYTGTLKWNEESKEMKFFDIENLPTNLVDKDLIKEYISQKSHPTPKVITMCGSFKFKDEILKQAEKLELKGNCVLNMLFPIEEKKTYTQEQAAMLGNLHLKKIEISDSIFVVNVGGYIGSSTQKEIEYAKSLKKEILYLEEIEE